MRQDPPRRPWIVAGAAALALAACGGGAPPPSLGGSGVHGVVTAGPTCPVERPDQPCPPNPVHGRVDALDGAGHVAASTTTDDAGRYSLDLASGDYTIHVDPGGPFPVCVDAPVTVPSGGTATADVDCDTGIR